MPRRDKSTPPSVSRRLALTGAIAGLGAAGILAVRWFNPGAEISGRSLAVENAHRRAMAGEIWLIDIRRPDEWASTGVGQGAHPLDMRRDDFTEALVELTGGVDREIALICARGVRSRRLSNRLRDAGFADIIDVPEGMFGSGAGPGWLRKGLPVVPVTKEAG